MGLIIKGPPSQGYHQAPPLRGTSCSSSTLQGEDFSRLDQSPMQGGPPSSYKWGYNSSYPFIRPFIGAITLFITSRGPPCGMILKKQDFPYFHPIALKVKIYVTNPQKNTKGDPEPPKNDGSKRLYESAGFQGRNKTSWWF